MSILLKYMMRETGCMAERLKDQLLEKEAVVDVIAGPDSYRSLPYLLSQATSHQVFSFIKSSSFMDYIDFLGQAAIDVILSLEETYADVVPVRLNPQSPSAYVYTIFPSLKKRVYIKCLLLKCQVDYERMRQHVQLLHRSIHEGERAITPCRLHYK